MKKIVIMSLALFLVGCVQAPEADLEGLKGMRDLWQQAFESGDPAAIAALYTEDGEVLPPNGETVSGRDAIGEFWAGFLESGVSGVVEDREAYAAGHLGYKVGSYTMSDADGNMVDEGKYVEVWRNVDGSWQLHRDIFNSNRSLAAGGKNRVVVMAEVKDTDEWEEGFRTHADLFETMSLSVSHYGMTDDNWVAVYNEPADLEQFIEVLESPATAEAMESDGIDRDTVKVIVIDKEFAY